MGQKIVFYRIQGLYIFCQWNIEFLENYLNDFDERTRENPYEIGLHALQRKRISAKLNERERIKAKKALQELARSEKPRNWTSAKLENQNKSELEWSRIRKNAKHAGLELARIEKQKIGFIAKILSRIEWAKNRSSEWSRNSNVWNKRENSDVRNEREKYKAGMSAKNQRSEWARKTGGQNEREKPNVIYRVFQFNLPQF